MKVNLHLSEACNYRCKHCFAHFESKRLLNLKEWESIIDNILQDSNIDYINFAGGEPLLYPYLDELIKYTSSKVKCSVITNGSLLSENWIKNNVKFLSCVGLSIDSFEENTLKDIGRVSANGKTLKFSDIEEICKAVKKYNSNCEIKINTVVSKMNCEEILFTKLEKLPISRWKIFKIREFDNEDFTNNNFCISDKEYWKFVRQNIGIIDDNMVMVRMGDLDVVLEDSMESSYIIVDAKGFLVDNSYCKNYKAVADLQKDNFADSFSKLSFSWNLYNSRYKKEQA